ncbi:chalcone isomerase family protein [Engelhardtia mirabilis]|uniref:Chalcone-flavanone isomerase n=1 Tax=Engelhardtia mirabilis TaxID=2528011 RepID=A0A518BJW7_9BACT|nr:Chalcone-flavanone isomerase [Planctomycetes bacterium Pla133]QDV01587.1 Chalcone-flavanone isomerase [Planctomycetes bacterium Pla86]
MLLKATFAKFLLASAGAVLVTTAGLQGDAVETIRESDTKVDFPVVRRALGPTLEQPGGVQHITGVAVRDKTVFSVNVYAYGLYVDPWAVQEQLGAFTDRTAKQLGKDEEFYAALMSDKIEKTLRIVFVRNVDAEDVVEAFDGSLAPRIAKARDEMELPDATAELETFKGLFDIDKLRKGAELVFSWTKGGVLRTTIDGELQPELRSPGLCWALFDVYLGSDPIEEAGRKKMASRIPSILTVKLPPKPVAEPGGGAESGR